MRRPMFLLVLLTKGWLVSNHVEATVSADDVRAAAEKEAELPLYTNIYFPPEDSSERPSHVPVLRVVGSVVFITIGSLMHVMTEEHHVAAAWVRDQTNTIIFYKSFKTDGTELPSANFTLPANSVALTPYAHCNTHGVWVGPTYSPVWEKTAALLVAANTRPGLYTATYFPIGFDGLAPTHVPVLTVSGMTATLAVGTLRHPMHSSHHISSAWVTDESGHIVFFHEFSITSTPVVSFNIPAHARTLTPYEHCTLHGVWIGEPVLVYALRTEAIKALQLAGLYTVSYFPSSYDDSMVQEHVPVLSLVNGTVTISVGSLAHEMSKAHFITAVWVEDQLGLPIFFYKFNESDSLARATFILPAGVTYLTPGAHCNRHESWMGETVHLSNITHISTRYAAAPSSPPAGLVVGNRGNVAIKSDLALSWTMISDDVAHIALVLSANAWLSLGVSKDGKMVTDTAGNPWPSKAVVGSASLGPQKRTLRALDPQQVTVDAVQDLQNASFTQVDGTTSLQFDAPFAWLEQHDPFSDSFQLIWAHGSDDAQEVAYHKQNRGHLQISRDDLRYGIGSAPTNDAVSKKCDAATLYASGQCFTSFISTESVTYSDHGYQQQLDLSSEYRLSWSVYLGPDAYIDIMLQARTLGWIGFGLMANRVSHGMIETDIWIGYVTDGVPHVHDAYAQSVDSPTLEEGRPGHAENLYDIRGHENVSSGVTTLQFKRKLEVNWGDPWDRSIIAGSRPCVFAFNRLGSDLLNSYHGPTRGFANVMFYAPGQGEVCKSGHIRIYEGSGSYCKPCPPGSYEVDNVHCRLSDSLNFVPLEGQNASGLVPCRPNSRAMTLILEQSGVSWQIAAGAASAERCICEPGFYEDGNSSVSEGLPACVPCPPGGKCLGGSFRPLAALGFASSSLDVAHKFHECTNYVNCITGETCDCLGGSINISVLTDAGLRLGYPYDTWPSLQSAEIRYICGVGYNPGSSVCSECMAGYASRLGQCQKCDFNPMFYWVMGLMLIFTWFPLTRWAITQKWKSLYTTASYVQYLGFFSLTEVTWKSPIHELLRACSFFNLNLDSVFFACAGFSRIGIWMWQMLIPSFFIVACVIHAASNLIASFLASYSPTAMWFMLHIGIRPWDGRQLIRIGIWNTLSDEYAPAAIFYLNSYYYSALFKAMKWFDCHEDIGGKYFLAFEPTMQCYVGEFWLYGAIALVAIIFYALILPLSLCRILVVKVKREGLQNERMLRVYGFLYTRFRDDVWYWEIPEIFRKFMFAFTIAISRALDLTALEQVVLILMVVVLVALCVLVRPFKFHYQDLCELATTSTEVILVVGSIVVVNRQGPDDYPAVEWIMTVAIFFGVSACVFGLIIDQCRLNLAARINKVRTRTGLSLSDKLFDVYFNDCFILRFLESASKDSIKAFKNVEDMLTVMTMKDKELMRKTKTSLALSAMCSEDLFLPEKIIFAKASATTFAPPEVEAGQELRQILHSFDQVRIPSTENDVPINLTFSGGIMSLLPNWILEHADEAETILLKKLKDRYHAFHASQFKALGKTTLHTRLAEFLRRMARAKPVAEKDRLLREFRRPKIITGSALKKSHLSAVRPARRVSPAGIALLVRGSSPSCIRRSLDRSSNASPNSSMRKPVCTRRSSFNSKLSTHSLLEQMISITCCEYAAIVPANKALTAQAALVVEAPSSRKDFLLESAPKLLEFFPGSLAHACIMHRGVLKVDLYNDPCYSQFVNRHHHRFLSAVAIPIVSPEKISSSSRSSSPPAGRRSISSFTFLANQGQLKEENVEAVLIAINKRSVNRISIAQFSPSDVHIMLSTAVVLQDRGSSTAASQCEEQDLCEHAMQLARSAASTPPCARRGDLSS